jgi:hypothetical protein
LSFTNSDTTSIHTSTEKNSPSIKYTQAINKIKQVLNILQNNLLNKTIPKNEKLNAPQTSSQIDKSISKTMTSDSLMSNTSIQTTYSVSSTLPILNNDLLQIEFDSLNSDIKLLNSAKNINTNQQTSEDDQTKKILHYTRSRSRKVQSFEFSKST